MPLAGLAVWCLTGVFLCGACSSRLSMQVGVTWCGVHMRQMAVSKVAFGAVVQLQAL